MVRVYEGDAGVRARHEIVELLEKRPDLWPRLNELTVDQPVDWPLVAETLFKFYDTRIVRELPEAAD